MPRRPRELAAWLAMLTGVALLLGLASVVPKRAKYVARWVPVHGQPCNETDFELLRVFPSRVEWYGRPVTEEELEVGLYTRKIQNSAAPKVYVDVAGAASLAQVGKVLKAIEKLDLRSVVLDSASGRAHCRQAVEARTADTFRRKTPASAAVQQVQWWRLW